MATLCEIEKHRRSDFEALNDAFDFLRSVRDLYRLTVSAENILRPEYLERAAKILGFGGSENSSERLLAACKTRTDSVARILESMIAEVTDAAIA